MGNDGLPMAGRTVVVTGATGGIGRVTARELARLGATVVAIGRDRERGETLAAEIAGDPRAGSALFLATDLSSQAEVRRVTAEVRKRCPRLDVLVNNAGAMFGRRRLSADGIEMTFALNHLGYFLLTRLLLPALEAAAPSRIVNVASDAHRRAALDLADLQAEKGYKGFPVYCRSKLANIHFTYELARRLDGSGVAANALHPGFVATDIGSRNRAVPPLAWRLATTFGAIGVEAGARTSVFLASSPEVEGTSGGYFHKCRPTLSSPASRDAGVAGRLWDISAEMVGLGSGL